MNIEAQTGRFSLTADNGNADRLILSSDSLPPIVSVLDGIELIGGALGEDEAFTSNQIQETTLFGKPRFQISLTRTQIKRYFDYEILNFLNYSSLSQMRDSQKVQ